MLVDFALSPRFDRELSAVIAESFPTGVVTGESKFSMVLDHFALQHRLPSGTTVVEAFAAAHPELTAAERDMLLGWQDVIEGVFGLVGKDGDALMLVNFLDELTYRARSNLGRRPFEPLKKGMIFVGRLVRAGEDWMVSGQPSVFPASARGEVLGAGAGLAIPPPKAASSTRASPPEPRPFLVRINERFPACSAADLSVAPVAEVPERWK